jgi:chemotaxis protein MotA
MDVLSVLGLVIVSITIVGSWLVAGGSLDVLYSGPTLVIVLGGIFGTAMIQSQIAIFTYSLKMMVWVIFPPKLGVQQNIEKIIKWSNIARKEGLLGLENIAESEGDIFARKGLQLLVDGNEPEVIQRVMQVEIKSKKQYNLEAAGVIESMGRYSFVVGIVAAVLGLMQITEEITNPKVLALGIETALVALAYGFGFAQFVFIPFSKKLIYLVTAQSQLQAMVLEGVLSIAEGENPRNIETKLQGFLP